jgi:DNA-binding Xre family transcriptional regulator
MFYELWNTHYKFRIPFSMTKITTTGRISILLGRQQAATGERLSPRRLAERAGVPKDFVYRLDSGQARHVDLDALARLCEALQCFPHDILVWENGE